MRLAPDRIRHPDLRATLRVIERADVPLVVWGGAVRDVLFSLASGHDLDLVGAVRDIDLALLVRESVPVRNLRYVEFGDEYTLLPALERAAAAFCGALGVQLGDLVRPGIHGRRLSVGDTPVELMGLRPTVTPDGRRYPDVFAIDTGETFSAVPASLSINRFALRGDGRLMGPLEFLDDFRCRTARLLTPPAMGPYSIVILLRLMDYVRRFDLAVNSESRELLVRHLDDLVARPDVLYTAIRHPLARSLIRVLPGGQDDQSGSLILQLIAERLC